MKALLLSLITLLTACSNNTHTHIKASELLLLLDNPHKPLIIDVRSSMEYNAGHVPSATHIPFWQSFTTNRLDNVDKTEIILYCEHGPRAGIAKLAYSLAGFKKIRYLKGHMTGWRAANYPMEK